ncbi:hypothetical protein EJ05DRAFT_268513 [Pseudovirgaria hyperparasitica]|uniref:Uncharacterized protein n=1 Tax=Pseudovirgaria hyperparasitica TaxID=470096 RepID=A0A6A6VS10_9PEZI|nr:uncharacterized protein EJ05DRAFT_268513 [Pseudovirgaria hyperparasitica]KAF2752699.1 hypothetical protein EJ05DRAFT_268513 [Pseudovirgaria hyperparasitica]
MATVAEHQSFRQLLERLVIEVDEFSRHANPIVPSIVSMVKGLRVDLNILLGQNESHTQPYRIKHATTAAPPIIDDDVRRTGSLGRTQVRMVQAAEQLEVTLQDGSSQPSPSLSRQASEPPPRSSHTRNRVQGRPKSAGDIHGQSQSERNSDIPISRDSKHQRNGIGVPSHVPTVPPTSRYTEQEESEADRFVDEMVGCLEANVDPTGIQVLDKALPLEVCPVRS